MINPNKINTIGWEDSPFITPDDQEFYFMYSPWNFFPIFLAKGLPMKVGPDRPGHHSNPARNPWEDADIYMVKRTGNGTWSIPINLNINLEDGECCMMLTPDKKAMYLQKRNAVGPKDKGDVYVSRRKPDGSWGEPVNIGAPVNTEWTESNPHVTAGEKSLYFMSDRPGSSHDRDLYVSKRNADGTWSEAVNLGPEINSGKEDQIWVNDAETEMYFGRENDKHSMYKSVFLNGKWQKPVPIRFGTDQPIGEISFSKNGQKAYFAVIDFNKKDIIMSFSELKPDGTWSAPQPMD